MAEPLVALRGLTVDFDTGNQTFSGVAQNGTGTLALNKAGSGSWTLTDCRLCKVAACTLSQPSAAAGSPVGAPATLVATLARAGSATGRRNCSGCFIACSR